ncbi:MAG: prolipoprotein diacylglyceryl transferase [Odoribacter sp.]|nr:prolipoprotein diacylglyceryl transferase [Odoribacter sp.]
MLSYFITWDVDPEIVKIGAISLRYYALMFICAFGFGLKIENRIFKAEGIPPIWLDKLLIYVFIATILGARLGHCIFYDWDYYSQHPLEMILPVRFNPFEIVGFQGLASHGAAIGIILALWIYSKKVSKRSILWILDRVVLPIALAGFFIRIGNLMNSEIIGKATTLPWGFRFLNAHGIADPMTPRHPAQLYEALCYLASFGVLMHLYWKTKYKNHQGFLFGMFLILIFTARFFIEFVKEPQVNFEQSMTLNMGQWLSIPFILVGLFMVWNSKKKVVYYEPPKIENPSKHKDKKKK